ncbi:hypothetical protein KFE25_004135 [Diacronema lutheri]|uniref:Heme NO-binding domain-containing protein n=2 Tax=Diacronema lutheri TaxID=2081491 RepID=A0A8J5X4F1_DIALT|nr:hypothetical protein KFE25_004135 [Diacronema lutheri]
MHGLIHIALRELVLQLRSQGFWELIVERTLEQLEHLDDPREDHLLEMRAYTDETTDVLLAHAFAVLRCDRTAGMLLLGDRHVRWLAEAGYISFLTQLRRGDVLELIESISKLHAHLERSFEHALLPAIKVFAPDGARAPFVLAYTGERTCTAPLFEGALVAAAELLCGTRLRLEPAEPPPAGCDVAWRVTVVDDARPVELADALPLSPERARKFAELHESIMLMPAPTHTPHATSLGGGAGEAGAGAAAMDVAYAGLALSMRKRGTRRESDPEVFRPRAHGDLRNVLLAQVERTHANAMASEYPPRALLRTVHPSEVSSDYTDPTQLAAVSEFWAQSSGQLEHFLLSTSAAPGAPGSPARGGGASARSDMLVFVSHAWPSPDGFAGAAGLPLTYAQAKASELGNAVSDLRRTRADGPDEVVNVRLWIDKACVAQEPAAKRNVYLSYIQDFILLSDEMIALLPWTYFERIWCMFEWACFLAAKQPRYLHVACEFMLTHDSAPMYVRAIRDLSVEHAHCTVAADRLILVAMINSSFRSVAAFELFAKVTAVALLARTTAKQAGRSGVDEFAQTWVELAVELKQPRLAAALRAAECARWRAQSHEHASSWLPESTFRRRRSVVAEPAAPVAPVALASSDALPGAASVDVGAAGAQPAAHARIADAHALGTAPISVASTPETPHWWQTLRRARARTRDAPPDARRAAAAARNARRARAPGAALAPARNKPRVELWQRRSWRDAYLLYVDRWFESEIEPLLLELKEHCVLAPKRRFARKKGESCGSVAPASPSARDREGYSSS